jgi:hypothetical protein
MDPKNNPKASTWNLNCNPCITSKSTNSISSPLRTTGIIEIIIPNFKVLATIEKDSLRFGRLPEMRIKKDAINDTSTAKNGVGEIK